MRTFRKGRAAKWILLKEEAALRRFGGTTFAVAGKVVRRPHPQKSTPNHMVWMLKEQSVKLLSMDEYAELASNDRPHITVSYSQRGSLLPPKLASATTKAISILKSAVKADTLEDLIPENIRSRYNLLPYADAVCGMHSPIDAEHYELCRRRMAFQELFVLQLKLLMQRARSQAHAVSDSSPWVSITNTSLIDAARSVLPYQLTAAQERALEVLLDSFKSWPPSMVLLQGDVGSGKTICAFLSILSAAASGYQAAIMVPTEILAEQHYASLSRLLEDLRGLEEEKGEEKHSNYNGPRTIPSIALLTGSTKRADRTRILDDLRTGKLDIVVGTHAIISQGVAFNRLGLAVIDEQHKFGVAQRAKLLGKGSPPPHILSMSATPIPRSLALVNYGEMRLVTIDELPPGRLPVTTHVLQDDDLQGSGLSRRSALYSAMQKELQDGGQVYIVCPAIGEKDESDEDHLSREQLLKGAIQERDRLVADGTVEGSQCSLLHGKMTSEEKERAMADFASGRTPVLISTTVVEVGVDVPAASMIIVEHAERFGLAQLHQLRGRVGRGHRASTCYLVASRSSGARELERLRVLAESSSGFEIAEADFVLRGAGDVIGRRQSGREGSGSFSVCCLPRDSALVELAREAAALQLGENFGSFLDHWPRELLAAVVDASVLDLDLAVLPTLRSSDDD